MWWRRKRVGKFETDNLFVSTVSVTDGDHPYETAVAHPDYNNGNLVVVDAYDSRAEAVVGHKQWVEIMTSDNLPDWLVDCQNSYLAKLVPKKMLTYKRKRKEERV